MIDHFTAKSIFDRKKSKQTEIQIHNFHPKRIRIGKKTRRWFLQPQIVVCMEWTLFAWQYFTPLVVLLNIGTIETERILVSRCLIVL